MKFPFSAKNISDEVAGRLKQLRTHWGLSQPIFAHRIGVPARSYQRYESGGQEIPVKVLLEISDQFSAPLDWIIRGDQDTLDTTVRLGRIDSLIQGGIRTKNDLEFVSMLIKEAYTAADEKKILVNARWLSDYIRACAILVSKPRNQKEILPSLFDVIPSISGQKLLSMKLSDLVSDLQNAAQQIIDQSTDGQIDAEIAKPYTDACLIVFLKGDFTLEENEIDELKKLYQPWMLLVAKRAILKDKPVLVRDTGILTKAYDKPNEAAINFNMSHLSARVLLSRINRTNADIEKKELTCGLTIKFEKREIVVGCNMESFMHLLETVLLLEKEPSARIGKWDLRHELAYGVHMVERDGVRIPLLKEEMDEFIALIKAMGDNVSIRREVQMEYAIQSGVI